jgi:hypothetical protein
MGDQLDFRLRMHCHLPRRPHQEYDVRYRLLGLLAVLAGVSRPAVAQTSTLTPGSKVRVHLAGQRQSLVGLYQESSRDSLFLQESGAEAGLRAVGLDQVTALETWGKPPGKMGRSVGLGVIIGAGAGALIGTAVPPPCAGDGWCIGPQDKGDMVLVGLAGGAIAGGLVGLLLSLDRPSGWIPTRLSLIQSVGSTDGVRLTWRFALPAMRAP